MLEGPKGSFYASGWSEGIGRTKRRFLCLRLECQSGRDLKEVSMLKGSVEEWEGPKEECLRVEL